jgi:hypothetical protein
MTLFIFLLNAGMGKKEKLKKKKKKKTKATEQSLEQLGICQENNVYLLDD